MFLKSGGGCPVKEMMDLVSLVDEGRAFNVMLLDRQRLNEQIAEKIQEQITEGKLKPDDQLPPERELAALLKVNRATVREAIHLLRERGLVERKNGRGVRVVAMPPDSVGVAIDRFFVTNNCSPQELWDFRIIFEPKVAALAAANAHAQDIKKLRAFLHSLEAAWDSRDPAKLAEADAHFHLALAAASHNILILAVATGLNILLERFMRTNHAATHSERSFRTHRTIYRAVSKCDPGDAERAMRLQLESTPISDEEFLPVNLLNSDKVAKNNANRLLTRSLID
jgi:GntR family transcriptional repressor for pyruvate dehydrogenase complex